MSKSLQPSPRPFFELTGSAGPSCAPQVSDITVNHEAHRALSVLLSAAAVICAFNKHLRKPYFRPHVVGLTVVEGPDPVTLRAADDHAPEYTMMQTRHRAGSG